METVTVPKQASWMIRKIFEARTVLAAMNLQHLNKGMIKKIYLQLLDHRHAAPWKNFMFQNIARPKTVFSLWLNLQGRIPTVDRLHKWKIKVDAQCCMCHHQDESRKHLFVQCEFARKIWNIVLGWLQRHKFAPTSWNQHQ